jgi:hypothetical protein
MQSHKKTKAAALAGATASESTSYKKNSSCSRQAAQERNRVRGAIPQAISRGFAAFECFKAAWLSQHPNATPAEYDSAMRLIAKQCGV